MLELENRMRKVVAKLMVVVIIVGKKKKALFLISYVKGG